MKKSIRIKIFIFLGFIIVTCFVFWGIIGFESYVSHADSSEVSTVDTRNLNVIRNLVKEDGCKITRVYSEAGNVETLESSLEPEFVDYLSSKIYSDDINKINSDYQTVSNPFAVTTIVDNGLPDSESIVVVFMGDAMLSELITNI